MATRCLPARHRPGSAACCSPWPGFPCLAIFSSSCATLIHLECGPIAFVVGGLCGATANPTALSDSTERMTQDNERKLAQVFRAVLRLSPDSDVTSVRQLNTPSWDSLAHVSLVAAVESEFGVSIEIADSLNLTSYPAIKLYLEEKST